jgi:RimJ/RimL family protein N-acetyltransferase
VVLIAVVGYMPSGWGHFPHRWDHGEMGMLPEILTAESVQLRCWRPSFTEAMLLAVVESFYELEQWMPWAQQAPTADGLREVLRQGEIAFHADDNWEYAIFDARSEEIVGAAGLHRTEATDSFEIGYWVRTSRTGRGIATSAAQTLVSAARNLGIAKQVVIRMDQANTASASVARTLGFTLQAEEAREITAISHTGQGYVWTLDLQDR